MYNSESKSIKKNIDDGFFEIRFFENGVYLVVYPPADNGKKVELNEVLGKLERKKIKNYDINKVEMAVMKANKIPVPIAPPRRNRISMHQPI